jgi:hypothetical protein
MFSPRNFAKCLEQCFSTSKFKYTYFTTCRSSQSVSGSALLGRLIAFCIVDIIYRVLCIFVTSLYMVLLQGSNSNFNIFFTTLVTYSLLARSLIFI